jgi:alpha-beta hydrolase superfamily lysophospholipase
VLSSPALATRLNAVQKMMLRVLPRIAPNFTVRNGLEPGYLSHDPAVVDAYRADPQVHDRVSGRLARFIADEGPLVLERARDWGVPTLLLYAGDDRLVDPAGSRAFIAAAPAPVITAHCFDKLYHEVFNEVEAYDVFARLRQWLDARF